MIFLRWVTFLYFTGVHSSLSCNHHQQVCAHQIFSRSGVLEFCPGIFMFVRLLQRNSPLSSASCSNSHIWTWFLHCMVEAALHLANMTLLIWFNFEDCHSWATFSQCPTISKLSYNYSLFTDFCLWIYSATFFLQGYPLALRKHMVSRAFRIV